MFDQVDLGGVNPMGARARGRWRTRLRNPVRKVYGTGGARLAPSFFQTGAAPMHGGGGGGGGGHGGGGHHGGGYPYYPYYYPYYGYGYGYGYPYLYPYAWTYPYYYGASTYQEPAYSQTVPSSCCYNVETGSLYCPGSEYDGAPAYAEATRQYQGRPMSFVASPKLGQTQWFWNCPTQAEPSALPGSAHRAPLRAANISRVRRVLARAS